MTNDVTTADIRGLKRDAAEAGDILQTVICDIAVDGRIDDDGVDRLDYEDVSVRRAIGRMTQAEAIAECARVIVEARRARRTFAPADMHSGAAALLRNVTTLRTPKHGRRDADEW